VSNNPVGNVSRYEQLNDNASCHWNMTDLTLAQPEGKCVYISGKVEFCLCSGYIMAKGQRFLLE